MQLGFTLPNIDCIIRRSASPCLKDPRGLRLTQTTYCSLLIQRKQLSSVTFCDTKAENEKKNESVMEVHTDAGMEGQTDVMSEIVI